MARDWAKRSTSSTVAQLPVAVVDGGHGARAHDALQVPARQAGHLFHRLLQRHLHLGQRRYRHPGRQVGVQHVILAHITVREHVVAQALGIAQTGAVAQHQPGVWAQHGDVVGDGLGVGRAHPDIDQGDTGMVAAHQVISRHLWQPRQLARLGRAAFAAPGDAVAGFHQHLVIPVAAGHQGASAGAELVDVELVVREQHEVLEMRGRGRRVVLQPVQRVVHALRGEGRQRLGLAVLAAPGTVDDGVVGHGQVGHVEQVAQRALERFQVLALDVGAFREGEMQGMGESDSPTSTATRWFCSSNPTCSIR